MNALAKLYYRDRPGGYCADQARYWRWQVTYPDGSGFEVRTLPEATYAEALTLWPGAALEPLADDVEAA